MYDGTLIRQVAPAAERGSVVASNENRAAARALRRAVVPMREPADASCLRDAYDRYRAVSSTLAPDLVSTPDVVAARVALTRTLLADGWDAPAAVLERLRLDEELLRPRLLVAS